MSDTDLTCLQEQRYLTCPLGRSLHSAAEAACGMMLSDLSPKKTLLNEAHRFVR
jgi:hypothetical protein